MFSDMDRAFAAVTFEFSVETRFSIRTFLVQFDAVFTLNQDLLMERHYLANKGPLGRWAGTYIPGVRPVRKEARALVDVLTDTWSPHPADPDVQVGKQPFFKLHGSSNWVDSSGRQLLVMGGNKAETIGSYGILKWNQEQFRAYLGLPSTRLMVIGYSFRDNHINQLIMEAAKKHGFALFIVDPSGLDVIDEHRRHPMYTPGPLLTALQDQVMGASRRSLNEIFRGDVVEYEKLMRFLR